MKKMLFAALVAAVFISGCVAPGCHLLHEERTTIGKEAQFLCPYSYMGASVVSKCVVSADNFRDDMQPGESTFYDTSEAMIYTVRIYQCG